jgi:hypothetical protein
MPIIAIIITALSSEPTAACSCHPPPHPTPPCSLSFFQFILRNQSYERKDLWGQKKGEKILSSHLNDMLRAGRTILKLRNTSEKLQIQKV